ncbi:MAG: sugar phosphate isomerase/epimerase [Rubellimicrobium sp.]|nr:sugar phosphate isomerase/epimerase [Rubellimicrobium sp.]
MTGRFDGLTVGLNPYGLTYTLGLQGAGTPRANPDPQGLDGFVAIAQRIGARMIDLHGPWLTGLDRGGLAALKDRLAAAGLTPVVSAGLPHAAVEQALAAAAALGAKVVRTALTTVLCGDRAARADWDETVARLRADLIRLAPMARDLGLTLAIENHQDFTAEELLTFCEDAGEGLGICLDTGNSFPVAEAPLPFAAKVAPRIAHVHLKDYRIQMTTEGYRLVRCAIGDGAVPVAEVLDILLAARRPLTASLEPAALEARHVRLFTPGWWQGYPPIDAPRLAAALLAAQANRLPQDADWRTPWERGAAPAEIVAYEVAMMERSAANMRALGIME